MTLKLEDHCDLNTRGHHDPNSSVVTGLNKSNLKSPQNKLSNIMSTQNYFCLMSYKIKKRIGQ